MTHLNYKHLHYFWVVATQGSIAQASQVLYLTPQTISGQLRMLEEDIGAKLFQRSGRNLALTETGRMVLAYADEMFRLGTELRDVLAGRGPGKAPILNVGVAMVVPKLIAYHVLEPALRERVRLVCHEATLDSLLADLAVHKLDLVLTDCPLSPVIPIRAYSHLLGESGVTFFATHLDAQRYTADFPKSLDGASLLMPTARSALRKKLEFWLQHQEIKPVVAAEFEDRALMKAFGEAGVGIFTSPTVVEQDVMTKYQVVPIGRTVDVMESFYLVSAEKRLKHPAVIAITDAARGGLFR